MKSRGKTDPLPPPLLWDPSLASSLDDKRSMMVYSSQPHRTTEAPSRNVASGLTCSYTSPPARPPMPLAIPHHMPDRMPWIVAIQPGGATCFICADSWGKLGGGRRKGKGKRGRAAPGAPEGACPIAASFPPCLSQHGGPPHCKCDPVQGLHQEAAPGDAQQRMECRVPEEPDRIGQEDGMEHLSGDQVVEEEEEEAKKGASQTQRVPNQGPQGTADDGGRARYFAQRGRTWGGQPLGLQTRASPPRPTRCTHPRHTEKVQDGPGE